MTEKKPAVRRTPAAQKQHPAGGNVVDITHEVVPNNGKPGTDLVVQPAVLTIEERIGLEIKKFNVADSAIAQLKETYGALVIVDLKDKDGYAAVKKAWNEVLTYRTNIEKKKTEIKAEYLKISKAIDAEENRLVDLIKPLEDQLKGKWKAIDELKEAAKKEAERKAEAKLQQRLKDLVEAGMNFNGSYYEIGGTISASVSTLREMSDEQYDILMNAVVLKREELRVAKEQKDKEDAEQKRVLDEQKEQLRQQQEKLDKQQEQYDENQRQLQAQKDKAIALQRQLKISRLETLGFSYLNRTRSFIYDNGFKEILRGLDAYMPMTDEEFEAEMGQLKQLVDQAEAERQQYEDQKEQERKVLEEKRKKIAAQFQEAGLSYDYNMQSFKFKNEVLSLSFSMVDLLTNTDQDLNTISVKAYTDILTAKKEAHKKEQDRKDQDERERKSSLDDKGKFSAYMEDLLSVEVPTMSSISYRDKFTKFHSDFTVLMTNYAPAEVKKAQEKEVTP